MNDDPVSMTWSSSGGPSADLLVASAETAQLSSSMIASAIAAVPTGRRPEGTTS